MTAWLEIALDRLAAAPVCGYVAGGEAFSEPTALAALALVAHGRRDAARPALDWLAQVQASDGSVALNANEPWPTWPTSLALLAWIAADESDSSSNRYAAQRAAAVTALLALQGCPIARNEATQHDTTLIGWPWVATTHSWLEPTAWAVLALRASGEGEQPRVREGVRLLVDRLLPEGGANYGNTFVLSQVLRPQVAPTGLAMLALAGEPVADPRVARSLDYLARSLGPHEATISLAWGVLGLAAQGRTPQTADQWLSAAAERSLAKNAEPCRLSALALAAPLDESPLVALARPRELAR